MFNLAFTAVELVGGFMTNTMTIPADALHDLGGQLCVGNLMVSAEALAEGQR